MILRKMLSLLVKLLNSIESSLYCNRMGSIPIGNMPRTPARLSDSLCRNTIWHASVLLHTAFILLWLSPKALSSRGHIHFFRGLSESITAMPENRSAMDVLILYYAIIL